MRVDTRTATNERIFSLPRSGMNSGSNDFNIATHNDRSPSESRNFSKDLFTAVL